MIDQVREGEVPAQLAALFRDVRESLRTPFVPLLFRSLAVHGRGVQAAWRALRPNVRTRAFEEAADDLRAHLATAAVNLDTPLIEPVLAATGHDADEIDELREQVDVFHYRNPKVLLCLGALSQALDGLPVGGYTPQNPSLLARLPVELPFELPELTLRPERPGGIVGELFREILSTTHLPATTIDLRAFGHHPVFLEVAWDEVGPVLQHPGAYEALRDVIVLADRLSAQLPFPVELSSAGLGEAPAAVADMRRIVWLLRDAMPRMALLTAALKVSLDGAQDALASPYPVEWDEPSTAEQLGL